MWNLYSIQYTLSLDEYYIIAPVVNFRKHFCRFNASGNSNSEFSVVYFDFVYFYILFTWTRSLIVCNEETVEPPKPSLKAEGDRSGTRNVAGNTGEGPKITDLHESAHHSTDFREKCVTDRQANRNVEHGSETVFSSYPSFDHTNKKITSSIRQDGGNPLVLMNNKEQSREGSSNVNVKGNFWFDVVLYYAI